MSPVLARQLPLKLYRNPCNVAAEISPQEVPMNGAVRTILIVILILFLIGSLPTWGYSAGWGPYPAGGLGLVLIIVVVLLLLGKL